MNKFRIFIITLLLFVCSIVFAQENSSLKLEKVTILSRHSVRAPLESYLSTLDEMTADGHQWTRWSVPGSNLTLKGGALEALFGEYFRLWLDKEQFKLDNVGQVYFGASSKQRTIATARFFAAGIVPLMTIDVDYKVDENGNVGYLDPDYLPLLNDKSYSDGIFDIAAFQAEAYRELGDLHAPSYSFLEKNIGMKRSSYSRKNGTLHFDNHVEVCLDFYDKDGNPLEPTMRGGLKDANMASDAFILQYYEMDNPRDAAFGRRLCFNDWKRLAYIKDYYGEILFTAPIISVNISHCMLKRIQTEMLPEGHKFAFLCSHDSMIAAVLAALRVVPYELPNTIEPQTPIGCKLVLEQWVETCCPNPKRFVRARLMYQSSDQIREMKQMDLDNPPMSFDLCFTGLEKMPNGMYDYDDFMQHLQNSIEAYNATAIGQHPFSGF